MRIFGREPALWIETVKAGLAVISVLLLPIPEDAQAAILVILTALAGVAKGFSTSPFRVTVLTDAIQTIGIAVAAFGVNINADKLLAINVFVGALAVLMQRSQITPDSDPAPLLGVVGPH